MNNDIVDKFNVENNDYHFNAILDPLPVEGSKHGVESGGVWQRFQEESILQNKQLQNMVFGDKYLANWVHVANVRGANCIKYANGIYVASSGMPGLNYPYGCYWSENGKDWYQGVGDTTLFNTSTVTGLKYTGHAWICITYQGRIYRSLDGKNWTAVFDISAQDRPHLQYLAGGDGIWVCGIQGAGLVYSNDDGATWNSGSIQGATIKDSYCIKYANGIFVAGIYILLSGASSSTWAFCWSEDGANWTRCITTSSAYFGGSRSDQIGIIYSEDAGIWRVLGGYSEDGKVWTVLNDGISFGSGRPTSLVDAVRAFGYFYVSTNIGIGRVSDLRSRLSSVVFSANSPIMFQIIDSKLFAIPVPNQNATTATPLKYTVDGTTWKATGKTDEGVSIFWLHDDNRQLVKIDGVWLWAAGANLYASFDEFTTWTRVADGQALFVLDDNTVLSAQFATGIWRTSSFEDLFNIGVAAP